VDNSRPFDAFGELVALRELVREVLRLQKQYFRTRDRSDLVASKEAEKRLKDLVGED